MLQVGGVRLTKAKSWEMEMHVKAICTTAAGNIVVRTRKEIQVLDRRGTKLTLYNELCDQHPNNSKWITEMIAGRYLADLCFECRKIRVVDMATDHAYRASIWSLWAMCSGPGEGSLLVWDDWSKAVIQLQWNEATKKLEEIWYRVQVPGDRVLYMCYIPHADLVILSCGYKVVKAVKLRGDAGQPPMWQLQGEMLGKKIDPWGVSCDIEGRVYVADGCNCRVLIVNGSTGRPIQQLLQDARLGDIWKVCWLSNPRQLLVQHYPPPDKKCTLTLYNTTPL